jgi:hypothetical protein
MAFSFLFFCFVLIEESRRVASLDEVLQVSACGWRRMKSPNHHSFFARAPAGASTWIVEEASAGRGGKKRIKLSSSYIPSLSFNLAVRFAAFFSRPFVDSCLQNLANVHGACKQRSSSSTNTAGAARITPFQGAFGRRCSLPGCHSRMELAATTSIGAWPFFFWKLLGDLSFIKRKSRVASIEIWRHPTPQGGHLAPEQDQKAPANKLTQPGFEQNGKIGPNVIFPIFNSFCKAGLENSSRTVIAVAGGVFFGQFAPGLWRWNSSDDN